MTVFGLVTFGEAVNLPPCNDPVPRKPCIQTWRAGETTSIYIPELAKSDHYRMVIEVENVDGLAERVRIESQKHLGADTEMLRDLAKKYGAPSTHGRDGETLADWAEWSLGELSVSWQGRSLERAHGYAIIESAKGQAFAKEQRARREAAMPKL